MTTEQILRVVKEFKNVVLEGVPGTGKTYAAGQLAEIWEDVTGRELAGRGEGEYAITMHPSTSYEDFVEGLRYDEETEEFRRRDGFILRVVEEAKGNADADYLVLLDEINRSNVPKVLGDLLLTLEPTKRASYDSGAGTWSGGMSVSLPYSAATFEMPDNVYVLGTMNTSDRSIAPLDAALRRRFAFVRIEPMSAEEILETVDPAVRPIIEESANQLEALNEQVLRPILGPDALLGHSYLLDITLDIPPLAAHLRKHLPDDVTAGFWTEHWSASGGSGNQFDLIQTGREGLSSANAKELRAGRAGPQLLTPTPDSRPGPG
jgi:5-methylcytosine-specific restriction endonuclease McrBC GTP-binding regulatory subunit McrB